MQNQTLLAPEYEVVGVGVGPTNLSLACLLQESRERKLIDFSAVFLEAADRVHWHDGQMFPGSVMLSEFYRDLVTSVDPTSRFSFLNFLRSKGRLGRFINSSILFPRREEFLEYFTWCAAGLDAIRYSSIVRRVTFDHQSHTFLVDACINGRSNISVRARNVVMGIGRQHRYSGITPVPGKIVHVSSVMREPLPNAQHILVVGGHQSGAECVSYLLDHMSTLKRLDWITSDPVFFDIDDSIFAREAFSDSYARQFMSLPSQRKAAINSQNDRLLSGISVSTSRSLYERLYYECRERGSNSRISLNTQLRLLDCKLTNEGVNSIVQTLGASTELRHDLVILCTGFESPADSLREVLSADLMERLDGEVHPNSRSYAKLMIAGRRLYPQSMGTKTHGAADANFITYPAKNAQIINELSTRQVYKLEEEDVLVSLRESLMAGTASAS